MGRILDFIRPNKNSFSREVNANLVQGVVSSESAGRGGSLTEEMQKAEDVTNYHMVHDDDIEQPLEHNTNPVNLGLRVCLTPLNRLAYISEYDAETYKLELESNIALMACDMEEDDYESGGDFLLESYMMVARISLDDAKKGHKAQILKSRQTLTRVGIESAESRKKNEGYGGFT